MSLRKRAEPVMLVRSPTLTNSDCSSIVNGSNPASRVADGTSGTERGGIPATAATNCATCSGVVPQQPPMMLTRPDDANSPTTPDMVSGLSSYSPNALGRPALG
ncbi:MAG: hypothetical protein BWY91_03151 [bacterium ADurb.BinA028]|nr:MAG: hypothetical protein BWY91_03151 [bacterium ADurb.BinA028]